MALAAGTRLGPYEIVDAIGAGGMGEVYRARDTRLDRLVAVKVLCETFGADARTALLREARAAAKLNHPNICTIHEIGDSAPSTGSGESLLFIVMEHVDGRSMSALAERGIEHAAVIGYAKQIADALSHAHDRGIVHRDLKCANLMVTADDRVKVLDFGIAKATGGGAAHATAMVTASGMISGTPPYMAPEVLRGEAADRRSDIWAIGVLLYEMTTGRRPFSGDTPFALSAAILRDEPPTLPRGVPTTLRSVIARCLEKDPAARFQRAAEIRSALEAAASVRTAKLPSRRTRAPKTQAPKTAPSPASRIRSIAVLPLDNVARDPEQEYLADGLTEELIAAVARIDGLRVISRLSIMRFKRTTKNAGEIARDLKVEALLAGSVRRVGDRVRIFVQLIDCSNDSYVWTSNFENDLREIEVLQSTIAGAVAGEIALTIRAKPHETRAPRQEAVEEFLRGRHFARQLTAGGVRRAIESFGRAATIDPEYAPAFAAIAEVYVLQAAARDALPAIQVRAKARAAAERALAIDPALPESHIASGLVSMYFEWDRSSAERSFKEALRLNPNSVDALKWYAALLIWLDTRHAAALDLIERASSLDPVDPWIQVQTVWTCNFSRDFERGIAEADRLVAANPQYGMGHYALAASLIGAGRGRDAVASIERAIAIDGKSVHYVAVRGMAHAVAGNARAAQDCLAELDALDAAGADTAPWRLHVHAGLGDAEAVIGCMESMVERRSAAAVHVFTTPYIDFVRNDSRVVRLFQTIGLEHLAKMS